MKNNKSLGTRIKRFIKKNLKRLKFALKNPFTYLLLFVVLCLVIATAVVKVTEPTHPDNEIIQGWKDAIWHTIVAVVAAYYDFYMKTVPGRLASLALLLFGMALWTVIMGAITSKIMDVQTKNNKGLKKLRRMKGHFLVCGWRPGFDKILDSVMKSNPDITSDMIVIVNNAPSEQIEQLRTDIRFKDVKYVSGDFSDATVLRRAFVDSAERALIISDYSFEQSDMEIDSRTVLAVLTMKNINSKVYVAAELLDDKFKEHLDLAHCDEVILTKEYEHSLLATASSGMGYSNVIKSMISDDSDSGIIIEEIPKPYIDKPYKELFDFYEAKSESEEILVGVLLNTGNFNQRKKEAKAAAVAAGKSADSVLDEDGNRPVLTPDDSFKIPKYAKAILVKTNA